MKMKQQETLQEAIKRQVEEREKRFGHYVGTKYLLPDTEYDEEEEKQYRQYSVSNPIIDRDKDEMQHQWAREANNDLRDRLSFNQDNR